MQLKNAYRLYTIVKILLEYGVDRLLPEHLKPFWFKLIRSSFFWIRFKHAHLSRGERIRKSFEDLGPVLIKFGQMLSTRRDLLPPDIADELAYLQDRVPSFPGELARVQIEKSLGQPIGTLFDDFDETPLASASIAQVHTATLKRNQKAVVIKVIRPDIDQKIWPDLRLMQAAASFVAHFIPRSSRFKPMEVVTEYKKTLLNELSLMQEAANGLQLRRNFERSSILYIPEIYSDLCHRDILVMERIYGIPVSDVTRMHELGMDLEKLAERGVEVFFTQVFRDSFFHADMHPGNIFVDPQKPEDPRWIGVDFGIVGTLNRTDRRYLAENFLAFFNRDYTRVAELHIESGWVPSDTNAKDFESAIRTVLEPIFEKPLSEISFGHVLLNLFDTARQFNMEVQPQLILLQKTLLYVEGLGRQLYPDLDLWKTAKPFLERWMKEQFGWRAILREVKARAPYWSEKLPEMPELLHQALLQNRQQPQEFSRFINLYKKQQRNTTTARFYLGIGATFLLGSLILLEQGHTLLAQGTIGAALLVWLMGWWNTVKSD